MNIEKPSLVDSVTNSANLIKKAQVGELCHVCYEHFLWNCSETFLQHYLKLFINLIPIEMGWKHWLWNNFSTADTNGDDVVLQIWNQNWPQFFKLAQQQRTLLYRHPHGYVDGGSERPLNLPIIGNFTKWKIRPLKVRLLEGT